VKKEFAYKDFWRWDWKQPSFKESVKAHKNTDIKIPKMKQDLVKYRRFLFHEK